MRISLQRDIHVMLHNTIITVCHSHIESLQHGSITVFFSVWSQYADKSMAHALPELECLSWGWTWLAMVFDLWGEQFYGYTMY